MEPKASTVVLSQQARPLRKGPGLEAGGDETQTSALRS
jgi:hypothetical protein